MFVDIVLPESGEVFAIEAIGALATNVDDVAFVEGEGDFASDVFLGDVDEGVDGFAEGGVPKAVVDDFGIFEGDDFFIVNGIFVEDDAFEVFVGVHENCAAGGFVDAVRLHADQTTFDEIGTADAVFAAEFVEFDDELGGGIFDIIDGDGVAFFKFDDDGFGFVRGIHRGDGLHEHALVGGVPRIF